MTNNEVCKRCGNLPMFERNVVNGVCTTCILNMNPSQVLAFLGKRDDVEDCHCPECLGAYDYEDTMEEDCYY